MILNQMNQQRNAFLDNFEPSGWTKQTMKEDIAKVLAKFDVQAVKKASDMTIQNTGYFVPN